MHAQRHLFLYYYMVFNQASASVFQVKKVRSFNKFHVNSMVCRAYRRNLCLVNLSWPSFAAFPVKSGYIKIKRYICGYECLERIHLIVFSLNALQRNRVGAGLSNVARLTGKMLLANTKLKTVLWDKKRYPYIFLKLTCKDSWAFLKMRIERSLDCMCLASRSQVQR